MEPYVRNYAAGLLVKIGDWGYGEGGGGAIWCRPKDRKAVQAAYDAIEDGDLGPDVLAEVIAAGGVYIPD